MAHQEETNRSGRQANWDILRTTMMFLVVVVHMAIFAPNISGHQTTRLISNLAIICDPMFFVLSGYFGVRKLKSNYFQYLIKKSLGIIWPIFVYAGLSYIFEAYILKLPLPDLVTYTAHLLDTGYWFVPTLLPFLVIAPILYRMLAALSDTEIWSLSKIALALLAINQVLAIADAVLRGSGLTPLISGVHLLRALIQPIAFSQYFIFFIAGYLIKRLAASLPQATINYLIWGGILTWMGDTFLLLAGVGQGDPHFLWLFVVIGIGLGVARLDRTHLPGQHLFEWTAKRSYAVYLSHFALFPVVAKAVLENRLFASLSGGAAFMVWGLAVICVYGLSLLVAGIVDGVLVEPIQHLVSKRR